MKTGQQVAIEFDREASSKFREISDHFLLYKGILQGKMSTIARKTRQPRPVDARSGRG